MKVTMLVAAHKAAEVPSDDFYLPIHVGHALNPLHLGYQPDDAGENISHLNRSYCELTALYWAWKNLDCDVIGLSHYRRYFRGSQAGPRGKGILSRDEALALLGNNDVVLPRPRNYYIETVESHYRNGHHGDDLDVLRATTSELSPNRLDAFNQVFRGTRLSQFNMFLMRREHFDDYASWLFPLLESVAFAIDTGTERTVYQQRTIGYLAERMLNVWAFGRTVQTVQVVNTEGEERVSKALRMVGRKVGIIDSSRRTR